MAYFYLNNLDVKNEWPEKLALANDLVRKFHLIFGWAEDETFWNWLENLAEHMQRLDLAELPFNIETAYEVAIIEAIDFGFIKELNELFDTYEAVLAKGVTKGLVEAEKVNTELLVSLDLSETGYKDLFSALAMLVAADREKLQILLKGIADIKITEEPFFSVISAALLHCAPKEMPVYFNDFKSLAEMPLLGAEATTLEWCKIVRYLAQAFYTKDAEVIEFVIDNFIERKIESSEFENDLSHLWLVMRTYLYFVNLKNLDEFFRLLVINEQTWQGLLLGVPVSPILKDMLAEESTLADYLVSSGKYADLLLDCRQPLLPFTSAYKASAGDFIGNYMKFAGGNELLKETSHEFLKLASQKVPDMIEVVDKCKSWLLLYLNLRECELIDYKGYLSDEKITAGFAWKEFFTNEVDVVKLEQAKAYLKEFRRPVALKIKIINTLQDLPWHDEPYFSKALMISDIYESIYGERYGQLVYFDEQKSEFALNRDLPNLESDFLFFATGDTAEPTVIKYNPQE